MNATSSASHGRPSWNLTPAPEAEAPRDGVVRGPALREVGQELAARPFLQERVVEDVVRPPRRLVRPDARVEVEGRGLDRDDERIGGVLRR